MPETRQCFNCGDDVTRAPSRFNGDKTHCSIECRAETQSSKVETTCAECGDDLERVPSRVYENNFCDRACADTFQVGENTPNWRGGSSLDNFTTTIEGREWRTAVFERDEYTCQDCGQVGGALNAHHIKRRAEHPELETDVSNGTTLCLRCHAVRHEGEECHSILVSNVERFA